jgi:hypothetical protein
MVTFWDRVILASIDPASTMSPEQEEEMGMDSPTAQPTKRSPQAIYQV